MIEVVVLPARSCIVVYCTFDQLALFHGTGLTFVVLSKVDRGVIMTIKLQMKF